MLRNQHLFFFFFLKYGKSQREDTMKKIGEWIKKERKKLFIGTGAILLLVLTVVLTFYVNSFSEDRSFQYLTKVIFQQELQGNTLSLHYTLKDPEKYGIEEEDISLGNFSRQSLEEGYENLKGYQSALMEIDKEKLSLKNQLTYDILAMYLETEISSEPYLLYQEPLGPTIGIQVQLPVLLAEYRFDTKKEIKEYLNLLQKLPNYYRSILEFEQEKAAAGLFMSDRNLEHILQQCREFSEDMENNYLLEVFNSKIDRITNLTEEEKTELKNQNKQMIESCVIPAYQILIEGLEKLKGSGKNEEGLCFLPDGKTYYEYLVKESTGDYDSIAEIEKRVQDQIVSDFTQLREIALQSGIGEEATLENPLTDPEQILEQLKEQIEADFPKAVETVCSVKYVHSSMEEYLSPAFYLTPPMDDVKNNVIYINRASDYSPLELFTTLAHEGFPGHLYQTTYFAEKMTDPIRSLLNFGGYVEGWATYVEMYSYRLVQGDQNAIEAERLNRSIMLGISTLMDISIHYHGCSRETIAAYLNKLGITSSETADQIYDMILESPANYLQYYVGYLNFEELKEQYQEWMGEAFTLKDFHQKVLEIGPAPFPIIEQYLEKEANL